MIPAIQNSYVSGELSPSFLGRTDKPQYKNGASTMRNMFVRYTGGAYSRAGFAYCGMCKQGAPNAGTAGSINIPPRDINFQYSINQGFALEFGDLYMRIKSNGAYVTEATKAVAGISQASPGVITILSNPYSNGDWVYGSGIGGMTEFNGLTWIVQSSAASSFTLTDLFGNSVNTTAYPAWTSGGTFARLYTVVSPYAAVDLPYLKFTQSANTMNLVCWNQVTQTAYAPYALQRIGQTNWVFTALSFALPIVPPGSVTTVANPSTTTTTWYSYGVTAVDLQGNESIVRNATAVINNDIAINAGSNVISWSSPPSNVSNYNIYAATPIYTGSAASVPSFTGVPYGLIGSAFAATFVDTNIIPDFTTAPAAHTNPFSTTKDYPGAVQYYQQRLVYANTINQPDTYFMSQPGLYNNFDSAIPTVNSDAIIGTPWAVQINGIQWMLPSIQGLLTFTGNGVWLINGGNSVAITPADQNAQAQAQVGCSALLPPMYINLHVLYVQAKNSIVRDIAFNFLYNTFIGDDITVYSNHLFQGHTLIQWAYSEEPFKVVWAVREDGTMLSLTYIKTQEIQGWARHDTNGLFMGVCTVIEPPVDAIYTIVKRYIPGTASVPAGVWAYYSERMDNRQWNNVEECFCVDAGLSTTMTFPNATLTPAAANGTSNISSVIVITGGTGYTSPAASAVDNNGTGINATFTVTQAGGVITAVTPVLQGTLYVPGITTILITDPTGTGAVVQPVITNYVTFTASSSVFTAGMVGQVIRADGGKATIISQTGTACVANITQPLTMTVPNDPNLLPIPATVNNWSVSPLVTTISGLNHLEGMTVTGLADGGVIVPSVVTNGSITLQTSASAVTVGLPFTAQCQTMYIEAPSQTTTQGKRKDIQSVTVRLEASRGVQVGTNQPDQSAQPNQATVAWTSMKEIKERNNLITAGSALPLFTGDHDPILVPGDWKSNGQVALQQIYPLPLNALAVVVNLTVGDTSTG
jgi:hypothetical protein